MTTYHTITRQFIEKTHIYTCDIVDQAHIVIPAEAHGLAKHPFLYAFYVQSAMQGWTLWLCSIMDCGYRDDGAIFFELMDATRNPVPFTGTLALTVLWQSPVTYDAYTQPIESQSSVTIAGTTHGFRGLTARNVLCVDRTNPHISVPIYVAIDPESQDVTITFVTQDAGKILITNPATKEPS